MAADEILGITGHFDISDIQRTIDELNNRIGSIGTKSAETGEEISKSFSSIDIAKVKQAIEGAETEIQALQKAIHANSLEIEDFSKKISEIKAAIKDGGNTEQLTAQIKEYEKAIEETKQNSRDLVAEHDALQSSLTSLAQKYNILAQAANAGQTASTAMTGASAAAHAATSAAVGTEAVAHTDNASKIEEETQKTQESIDAKKALKEELKNLQEGFSEINDALTKYADNTAIQKQEQAVARAAAAIERFKQQLASGEADAGTLGAQQYMDKLQQRYDRAVSKLQDMKREQERLKNDQADYTNAINETNKKIEEGAAAHKKNADAAKKAAAETKKIGKEADDASKKVSGIFSGLKTSLGGALKGDFSGIFGFIGKIGVWGASLAAVGKGLYELTVRAEQFRAALQPLSHYLDDDTLKNVRQNIIALSDETTKSVSDMAKAATTFVKVWESLRSSPTALTTMIKASNEFGALAGKTSEDAAKELSKLASMYHLTAQETTELSNIIATASRNSVSSFSEMASALESAGANASSYGVSFRDIASVIGYSSNNFGSASQAASKFNMVLMTMSGLQKEYNPRLVGLVQALENLKAAYDSGERVQDKFMKRTQAAAMYFIQNADAIAKYSKSLDDNKAKNELLADASTKASTNIQKLKNAWDGFLTSINANFTPILTNVLNFFNKIIGGAQKTADELRYLQNFDKRHDSTKNQRYGKAATSGMEGFAETSVALRGAQEADKPNLEAYRKQRDKVYAYYDSVERALRKKWSKASGKAIANGAGNLTVRYFERNRGQFSALSGADFNDLLRDKRQGTILLSSTPINSGGNNNNYTPKDTKGDEIAKKQRQYREAQAEQDAKLEADTKKQQWQLYVAESEKAIAEMHDANEKEIAQRKLDFEKKKHAIEEEAEQMRQANIAAAKAEYEKNPANEKKEGFYARGLDKNITLNETQQKTIDAKYSLLNAQQKAETEKNLKAVTDRYKTENQQRADIEKKYNDDIVKIQRARAEKEKELAEATTEEQKKQIEQQITDLVGAEAKATKDKGEAVVNFDFDLLKKNPEYIAAFEDLNNISTETLTNLISLFEQFKVKAAESMSPDQLREFTSTMQSMYDEIASRDPFKAVASARVDYSSADAEVKAIEKKINALKKGQKTVRGATKQEEKLTEAYNTQEQAEKALAKAKDKRAKAETKLKKAQKEVLDAVAELASSISNLGNVIGGTEGEILELIANTLQFVITACDSINKVSETSSAAIRAIESASVILAIISAAIQLLQQLSTLYKDSHAQYEEYAEKISEVNKLANSVNEYKLAVIEAKNAEKNWFASNNLSGLHDAWEYNQQALESYVEAATQAQAIYQNESSGGWLTNSVKAIGSLVGKVVSLPGKLITKGLEAVGLDMSGWIGKVVDWSTTAVSGGVAGLVGKGIGSLIDNSSNYKKGTTAAINNLRIETRKKSSGFLGSGIGGKSQKTEDLRTWAKENYGADLFDENNWVNTELANQIIEDYGDKLVGETKETLQTLVELKENYDKFTEQVEEYVSEMYSPLADNLTDALWDWLSDGEDVMDKFKEYASDTFADIAKEIIKTQITSSFFDTFSDSIKELYKAYGMGAIDESQLASSVKDSTKTLMATIETQLPALQDVLKAMDEQFQELGIDIAGANQSEQSATSKAIEAITEDQADALTGIGYAMQIALEQGNATRILMQVDISGMRTITETISANITEMRDIQYQSLNSLQAIAKNTTPIIIMNETMENMYKLMKDKY